MTTKQKIIILIFLLTALASSGFFIIKKGAADSAKLEGFALCLNESGAKFYGAFWCSHCQNQKALFGSAAKDLPYVECSATDGKSQLPICNLEKIQSYPTWVFKDGSREIGELSLEELAKKTGCAIEIR